MGFIRAIVAESEPLLLFLVIGIGFLLGQIKYRGFKLGVAGVLFTGLFFGAWRPEGAEPFAIAHQVMQIGLILFVYTIGLSSGAGFFASLKNNGFRFNIALVCALSIGAIVTLTAGLWMNIEPGQIAGVFCGGLTNTPALAASTELIHNTGIGDPSDPAIGYSMTYPFGILGGMLAFQVFAWVYRKAGAQEQAEAAQQTSLKNSLKSADFEIRNPALIGRAIGELRIQDEVGLIISRHQHNEAIDIPTKYSILQEGDVITAVGAEEDIEKSEQYFGTRSKTHLVENPREIIMRRILVSRKEIAGQTVQQLDLSHRFNAQITRLRRADVDITPDYHNTTIQIGDRIRVVMPKDKAADVASLFGDSEQSVAELDYTALTLGISLGVLIGMIPIPIPGGTSVSLGFAGGPLIAGLILGYLGRTGPLVWSLPSESNNALRHIGLLFFLAAVGVMTGGRFLGALSTNGWQLLLLGILTTAITTTLTLLFLRHYGKATVVQAIGATSGMQTQPATLARAYEMSRSDETYVAYATTYPVAMVGKILIAQLIIIICSMLSS